MNQSALGLSLSTAKSFSPNYPAADPIFYIPRVPEFAHVHEPLPPKKPPPPGYDLKTLRKQVEYLNEEIRERQQNTAAMSVQNNQLWDYIQELLEANKFNAATMRTKVAQLNEELRVAQKERFLLLQKLDLAKNSKKMMDDLSRELEEAQVTVEEMQRRKKNAEQELKRATLERENLEETLHSQVKKMHSYEDLLSIYENKKIEEDAIDKAEEYFFSSRTILKAAYGRFKQGVIRRQREHEIQRILSKIRREIMYRHILTHWKTYMHRVRIMRKNTTKRNRDLLMLFFKQWKLDMALERVSSQSRRRQLIYSCFARWKTELSVWKRANWANERIQAYRVRVFKRRTFRAWKREVMFLDWCTDQKHAQEQQAHRYFIKYLFQAWKRVSHRESIKHYGYALVLAHNVKKYHYKAWYGLCKRHWTHRGKLLKRFFQHIRLSIQMKNVHTQTSKYAMQHYLGYRKYHAVNTWKQFVRRQAHRVILDPYTYTHLPAHIHTLVRQKTVYVEKHYYRRVFQSSFLQMVYRLMVNRRQRLVTRMAMQHYVSRIARKGLTIWSAQHKQRVYGKKLCVLATYTRVMGMLHSRVRDAWYVKSVTEGLERLKFSREKHLIQNALEAFVSVYIHHRRVRCMGDMARRMCMRRTVSRALAGWRGVYSSKVYWELKTLKIDHERLAAIAKIREQEREEAEQMRQEKEREIETLKDAVSSVKEMLEQREVENEEQKGAIERYEQVLKDTKTEIEDLTLKIRETEDEVNRWKSLEDTLRQEREYQAKERERRKQETEEQLQRIQRESRELQSRYEEVEKGSLKILEGQVRQAEGELRAMQEEDATVQVGHHTHVSVHHTLYPYTSYAIHHAS
ncbi:hypothetical protein EON65_15075 [archaeon]|nr:MAG: hypothetical protein EON65_15075 [archaeon]